MCNIKFYICKHCGNIIGMIHSSGVPVVCCGEPMALMQANTSDGAKEKHVPELEISGGKVIVKVGSVAHPMSEEHHIAWIYLQTENGGQRKCLKPGEAPEATFALEGDNPVAAFAYCNLHGLWVKEA